MSQSLNHVFTWHELIFTSKWLFSLFFSTNYYQTGNRKDQRFVYMLFSLTAAQVHRLARLWSSISAVVLYVVIYQLDLRNIQTKTINLVYYSTHTLILKYFNRRNKLGWFFCAITGMTHIVCLFYITRFWGDLSEWGKIASCCLGKGHFIKKKRVLKICTYSNIMMLLVSWHIPLQETMYL